MLMFAVNVSCDVLDVSSEEINNYVLNSRRFVIIDMVKEFKLWYDNGSKFTPLPPCSASLEVFCGSKPCVFAYIAHRYCNIQNWCVDRYGRNRSLGSLLHVSFPRSTVAGATTTRSFWAAPLFEVVGRNMALLSRINKQKFLETITRESKCVGFTPSMEAVNRSIEFHMRVDAQTHDCARCLMSDDFNHREECCYWGQVVNAKCQIDEQRLLPSFSKDFIYSYFPCLWMLMLPGMVLTHVEKGRCIIRKLQFVDADSVYILDLTTERRCDFFVVCVRNVFEFKNWFVGWGCQTKQTN